jgi:UDPglucose 6-dehydrogenase
MTVAREIAGVLPDGSVVVIKSTVPPGTATRIAALFDRPDLVVASNPEFLREGTAVADFLRPDRIVIGSDIDGAAERVAGLYTKLEAPVVVTSTASAELAKYAANCFLAVKLSYINEVASLCERAGADIHEVAEVLGHDPRIGASHLRPGPGWGGPCLPKDAKALLHVGCAAGSELTLLRAAVAANWRQQLQVVDKIRLALGGSLVGTRIALLGLTFKPGTGDLRDSPAIAVATLLAAEQAQVVGCDPAVRASISGTAVSEDPYDAVTGADAVVILTDWPQFRTLDWTRIGQLMTGHAVIDTRNHLDPAALDRAGLRWHSMGRSRSTISEESESRPCRAPRSWRTTAPAPH